MSKKVGIVTLTKGANYGNKLQHYAIVKILDKLGYKGETVVDLTQRGFANSAISTSIVQKLTFSYICKAISSRLQYKCHRKNQSDGVIKCIIQEKKYHDRYVELEKERQQRFDYFTDKYIPVGTLQVSATQKSDEARINEYIAFVCGSDQVWNPLYKDSSPVRFLRFAPAYKRIALSPSFGVAEIPENRKEIFGEMIREIPHLSIRETNGAKIIRELTGREDVQVLVDPTLMLDSEEWEEIERKPQGFPDSPFLLTYFLGNKTKEYEKKIEEIAEQKNLRIVNLFEIRESESFLYDPSEFLWLIHNASFVCTDSFHGTVFSIIFKTKFLVFMRNEVGFSKDSRVSSLLDKLEIEGCVYGKENKAIDGTRVAELLEKERNKFNQYLKSALKVAESGSEPVYAEVQSWNRENPAHCTGCSACTAVCDKKAIEMKYNEEGFLYPEIDKNLCVLCGKCVRICSKLGKSLKENTSCFGFQNEDDEIRKESSSGGVFFELAKSVIKDGGVVFGAKFDNNNLIHDEADTVDFMKEFMGSKYLQSDMKDCFSRVKEYLDNGRKVLFTGTPCQISGLHGFLEKEYDNLLMMDLICHGVPSQRALDIYLKEQKEVGKIHKISFRNKDKGWGHFSLKIEGDKGTYCRNLYNDPYLKAFLSNINLRESCYDCRFKTVNRVADITLGDFWGVKGVLPQLDDNKGTSLVICHSTKGIEALKKVGFDNVLIVTEEKDVFKRNGAMTNSVLRPNFRDSFYYEIEKNGFVETINRQCKTTIRGRIGHVKEYIVFLKKHWKERN